MYKSDTKVMRVFKHNDKKYDIYQQQLSYPTSFNL